MTRGWKVGDVVRLFEGAYGTGTIVAASEDGRFDVARPHLAAHEVGGWCVAVELVRSIDPARLVPAETDLLGNPRTRLHGCYTHEDLKKVASGEWKI